MSRREALVSASAVLRESSTWGLHGHVQGGGGLIGQDDRRVVGHGDGDDHPLAHTAGELVRVVLHPPLGVGDPHQLKERHGLGHRLVLVDVLVGLHGLGDLPTHRVDRVEGGHRILEDHGDADAADLGQLLLLETEDLAPCVGDRTGHRGVLCQQAHGRQGGDRFSRSGLADDAQHLLGGEGETDATDGTHRAVAGGEVDHQVVHGHRGVGHVRRAPGSSSGRGPRAGRRR